MVATHHTDRRSPPATIGAAAALIGYSSKRRAGLIGCSSGAAVAGLIGYSSKRRRGPHRMFERAAVAGLIGIERTRSVLHPTLARFPFDPSGSA